MDEATEKDTIVFRWGRDDPATGTRERTELESLPAEEFLRRYLQHVPPPRYQMVRHDGLYTSAKKAAYEQAQTLLSDRHLPCAAVKIVQPPDTEPGTERWQQEHTCPMCGKPLIVSALLPSSLTGTVIPRVSPGQVLARPPNPGGTHAP
ncbi:MAG: hypothetical protein GY722_06715 [bacterium]|nr:hypothetical protein [bacterium]